MTCKLSQNTGTRKLGKIKQEEGNTANTNNGR